MGPAPAGVILARAGELPGQGRPDRGAAVHHPSRAAYARAHHLRRTRSSGLVVCLVGAFSVHGHRSTAAPPRVPALHGTTLSCASLPWWGSVGRCRPWGENRCCRQLCCAGVGCCGPERWFSPALGSLRPNDHPFGLRACWSPLADLTGTLCRSWPPAPASEPHAVAAKTDARLHAERQHQRPAGRWRDGRGKGPESTGPSARLRTARSPLRRWVRQRRLHRGPAVGSSGGGGG